MKEVMIVLLGLIVATVRGAFYALGAIAMLTFLNYLMIAWEAWNGN